MNHLNSVTEVVQGSQQWTQLGHCTVDTALPARQCNSQHRTAPTDRTVTSRPYDDIQLPAHSQQLKPAAENDIQQLGLYDSSETTII